MYGRQSESRTRLVLKTCVPCGAATPQGHEKSLATVYQNYIKMIYVWEARGTNEGKISAAFASEVEGEATGAGKGARHNAHGAHHASAVGLCEEPRREGEVGLSRIAERR